ncbi:uncharacterized protein RCO7_09075 [Rhynchosporium graminicola]|uniref:Uncharacterized protein n=1 Tax=Rhynchosporium graminicola TaxID=2792576 RepID=A0A1E1LPI1_9HELO|nr:uncharacterized protein RCO7_09075 [Rhynchosporium commune]
MILRPAKGSHICLRCQRGLAKHANASLTQRGSQSTDSKSQKYSGQRTANSSFHADNADDLLGGIGNALDRKEFRNGVARGGLYGHRGLQVQETREQLNNTTLGDPANVIVLRDSKLTLYAADRLRKMKAIEPEHIDILNQLEEERGLVGQKEVDGNIDELRPTIKRQSWEQMNELVKLLQEGFTILQLQRYIHSFEGRKDLEPPEQDWVPDTAKTSKILRVTPWLPGVSETKDYFNDDPLRGYFLSSHTTKQRIALQLLRECWMLEMPELVDGVGQFELQVRKEDLELLLTGDPSVLDQIHSEHLSQENERLEAFRKRSVIRVTAPHVKKRLIVHEVEAALKRVRRTTIPLVNLISNPNPSHNTQRSAVRWANKIYDLATIKELARLTNTSIFEQQDNTLVVSCIDTDEQALVSSVDVARRLLLTSSNLPDRVKYQLIKDKTKLKEGVFLKHEVGNTLPWRDRLRSWARWTAPTTKTLGKPLEPVIAEKIFDSKPEPQHEVEVMEVETDDASISRQRHWNSKYFTETSAVLGKVLHESSEGSNSSLVSLESNDRMHTFSEQAPSLTRIISKSRVEDHGEKIDKLVLRFLPDPFAKHFYPTKETQRKGTRPDGRPIRNQALGCQALVAFPAIEMHFRVDRRTKHASLRTISAIVEESKTDVLLPQFNTDVRFRQRTTSRLLPGAIEPFRRYLANSDLSLIGSSILQTPPSIRIPIDKHLCRGEGLSILGKIDAQGNQIPDTNAREVDYLFAGLEVRTSVSFEYRSCRLIYTSIEAGKAGGQRSELKLRPVLGADMSNLHNFFDMAYKLAGEVSDQDTESLVPTGLAKPRRVGTQSDPKVVRYCRTLEGIEPRTPPSDTYARRVPLGRDTFGDVLKEQQTDDEGVGRNEERSSKAGEEAVDEKKVSRESDKAKEVEKEELDGVIRRQPS